MASKKERLRIRLADWLQRQKPPAVDEEVRARIEAEFGEASPRMIRDLLRESGVSLTPLVEGVRQDTLENLERTLLALTEAYHSSEEAPFRRQCRATVIEAKDHARFAVRNPKVEPDKRALKEEMVLWMLTWLENPEIFPDWVGLRKARLTADRSNRL